MTPRNAREQQAFRQMLDGFSRPGTVTTAELHEQGGVLAGALTLIEALVDHEVSFCAVPGNPEFEEAVLRLTGSHLAPLIEADYVVAEGSGIIQALCYGFEGELEYPDRNATVVASVNSVSARPSVGEAIVLSGPGIRDTTTVWVEGFGPELQNAFRDRNRGVPLGIDLILIAPDGRFTCLPRYTRIHGGN